MRAAIYARKSTDDNARNADNKSVTRQVERGRAYARDKGWTANDEHVFVDDGLSGADFGKRLALLRLLTHLREFDVIIMSELSRLGREQFQTNKVLADIAAKGVRVFFYLTNEELNYDSAVDKFMLSAVSFAAELEREKASQRSRDALERKARHGYNTGGVVYGYSNVVVYANAVNGDQSKSHTDYQVHEEQAETLVQMFTMYADGHGFTSIAKTMNGAPAYADLSLRYFGGKRPAAPRKGTGSWAPSSIREILHNERYRGKVPFGEFRKVYRGGVKQRERTGPPTFAERPDLRIIPEDLWKAVQHNLSAARRGYLQRTEGKSWGPAMRGVASPYLLSGLARCSCCGSSMVGMRLAVGSRSGRRMVAHYACSYNNKRGVTVCSNNFRHAAEPLEDAVIAAIERTALTPAAVDYVLDRAMKIATDRLQQGPAAKDRLHRELKRLVAERDNFLAAIALGKRLALLMAELERRETRICEIQEELASQPSAALVASDLKRLRTALAARMADFKGLLRSDVPKAREALRKLLNGPIQMVPTVADGRRIYVCRGETKIGALLASAKVASPRGFEPRLPP